MKILNFIIYFFISSTSASLPVVLWHGMGDSCCNPLSMGKIKRLILQNMPANTYIKSIQIGKTVSEDVENSFFMNVNDQVTEVCNQLAQDVRLTGGYNAIGFSQGGQFLRAVVQRCPNPPVNNLISIGGQHQGVYGLPHCFPQQHKWCDYIRELLDKGAYWGWVQHRFVQAEYWHDPINLDGYRKYNIFLADINNENFVNETYRQNLMKLNYFVMVMFEDDSMVQPKESSFFEFYAPGQSVNITKLPESPLYIKDLIGLKNLNENNKLKFYSLPGDHLQFTQEWFVNEIVNKFLK